MISPECIPFPPTNTATPVQPIEMFSANELPIRQGTNRFNEAAVDPRGRFLAGTMGYAIGELVGTLYTCERIGNGYRNRVVLKDVTCTNGMDWTPDHKTMYVTTNSMEKARSITLSPLRYFTDSWTKEIVTFDYDIVSETRVLRMRQQRPQAMTTLLRLTRIPGKCLAVKFSPS
jgi:hypothetical protein